VTIFREGEPGDAMYVVVEGHVKIMLSSGGGEETTVAVLGPGQCFGDQSLLDGGPRSASAVTADPTKTLMVTREIVADWLAERPAAALAIMETLSLRLRRMNEQLVDRNSRTLTQRLAKQILSLSAMYDADEIGAASPGRVKVTQAELASMLGVSRETVNKQVNLLQRSGLISLGRGSITIKDAAALQALD